MGQIDVFRSDECVKRYREHRAKIKDADLTKLPQVERWGHWILVKNEYPYDRIAQKHCLLVPLRSFAEDEEMNGAERKELFMIKKWFARNKSFDILCESLPHDRSVPGVYHLHCMGLKFRTPLAEL